MKAMTEKRFGEYHEDDKAVSLRNRSGTCGGGSEVLVVQSVRSNTTICWWKNMEYAMQRIGEYTETTKASNLKMRDYKDATDLILRGGAEHE